MVNKEGKTIKHGSQIRVTENKSLFKEKQELIRRYHLEMEPYLGKTGTVIDFGVNTFQPSIARFASVKFSNDEVFYLHTDVLTA